MGLISKPLQAALRFATTGPSGLEPDPYEVGVVLDDIVADVNAIGITGTDEPMKRVALSAPRFLLGSGLHAGCNVDGAGVGSVEGVSLSASAGPFICSTGTTVVITGLEITGSLASSGAMLHVRSGARAIVSRCVFAQQESVADSPVLVDSGGKLFISDCVFTGMGTTSDPVINHLVATPAHVVATMCFNLTGNTFHNAANVTATHILT